MPLWQFKERVHQVKMVPNPVRKQGVAENLQQSRHNWSLNAPQYLSIMNFRELNQAELQHTNGGALLGLLGDDSMLKGALEGYVNISHTDEDGNTESTNLGFGLGSIFESMND